MTVGHLLESFLADFAALVAIGERRASTLASYRSWVSTWLVELAGITIDEICSPRAPSRLRAWAMDVARRASARKRAHDGTATASRCLVVLDLALKRAEFEGVIPRGSAPTRLVRRFAARTRDRFLDERQVGALLAAIGRVEEDRVARRPVEGQAPYYSLTEAIRLLAFSGMRRNEVFRLRWSSVDIEARVVRLPVTKTRSREVPLSDDAIAVLRRQATRHASAEWVFPSVRGDKPIRYAAHVWGQVVRESGLDPLGLVVHTLRHSLATCALRAGAPLEHVATVLGHASTAITRRVYGRPLANPGAFAVVDNFARDVRARRSLQ